MTRDVHEKQRRAAFQVLVFPYRQTADGVVYALFRRSDGRYWQEELALSSERTEYRWFGFDEAMRQLRWDSNRNALWELDHRLKSIA